MSNHLTLAAQERIRFYDQFKRLIDAATKHESEIERFAASIDTTDRKFHAFISQYDARPLFIFGMKPDEKLADMAPVIDAFESVFGPVKSTKDETEYEFMTRRRFESAGAELLIEVPSGSVTCRRVPTGETKVVETYKIECVETADTGE